MKPTFFGTLSVSLVAALVGCGDVPRQESTTSTSPKEAKVVIEGGDVSASSNGAPAATGEKLDVKLSFRLPEAPEEMTDVAVVIKLVKRIKDRPVVHANVAGYATRNEDGTYRIDTEMPTGAAVTPGEYELTAVHSGEQIVSRTIIVR